MVPNNMDALEWLREHLDGDGSDLRREMVRTFAERLMACEVDVLCNAGYGAAGRSVTSVSTRSDASAGSATGPVREDSTGCTFVARLVIGARHACEGGYVHGGQGH